jgi:hypothetical protein
MMCVAGGRSFIMGHPLLGLVPLVVALTMFPTVTCAQDWSQPWADPEDRPPRVDVSAAAGFLMPTRWSDLVLFGSASPTSGALEQVLTRDVRVEPDTALAASATYWRARYGFRTQAGLSRSSLNIGGPPVVDTASSTAAGTSGDITSVGIDTWLYEVAGLIGFVDYDPSRRVWPYGFVGLGGITYDLDKTIAPSLAFVERGPSRPGAAGDTIVIVSDGRQFLLTTNALSTETVFAVNFGLGADFRIPLGKGGVGLRLEVADRLAPSPLALRVEQLSSFGTLPSDTGVRYRFVHHLSATAGLVLQIGR